MAIAPVHRLTKKKILDLSKFRCRHSHTGLEHYSCWLSEFPLGTEKVGYLDIETTQLKANIGIIISYCIKEKGKRTILGRCITKKELFSKGLDKSITKDLIRDMATFDRVITYYGTGFDLKFIRTRATVHDLDFPEWGEIYHTDVYYLVRNKFCLSSNRLAVACEVLLGRSDKTAWLWNHWTRAVQGNKKSLNYIHEHNRIDVRDLEKLHNKIIGFKKESDNSI